MSYLNKYNDFKAECIIHLRQLLKEKGYDKTSVWEDECGKHNLPIEYYMEDFGYELYSIIKYDMDGFKGIGWESGDEYWFEIDELDLKTICYLIDLINND